MRFSTFALFAAATVAMASAAEIDAAESEFLMDFWSKFDGWKWNCSAYGAKGKKESEELESEIEKSGEEPEWLMTEWVNKMMAVKHNKHNLTELESGKLTKMWSICDWFKSKTKKNHTKVYKEDEPEFSDEAELEVANDKADEEFLLDFFKGCSAFKKNKTWTWGWAKKNFTWFSKAHKEGEEMTAEIEN